MDTPALTYFVDKNGDILSIKGPWDSFAQNNDGPALAAARVRGQNLFSFIKGQTVAMVYRAMHDLLWSGKKKQIAFAFRCDGPRVRRDMRMTIVKDGPCLVYTSTVEKETPLERPLPLRDAGVGADIVAMCSFCKDFRYPREEREWRPVDDLFDRAPERFQISHGICDECMKQFE